MKQRFLAGLILFVAILLVALVVYLVVTKRERGFTLKETKDYLLADSKIALPTTSPLRIVAENEWPQALRFFILKNAEGVLVKRGTQENGKYVYKVTFVVDEPLSNSYEAIRRALRAASGWEMLRGSRANLFAVIEARSAGYEARVNLSPETRASQRSEVVVEVVRK